MKKEKEVNRCELKKAIRKLKDEGRKKQFSVITRERIEAQTIFYVCDELQGYFNLGEVLATKIVLEEKK